MKRDTDLFYNSAYIIHVQGLLSTQQQERANKNIEESRDLLNTVF